VSDPNAPGMRVVVGVTGGIACYKAVGVVRQLTLLGHDVHVIPTHSALQFVGAATWEAISHNPVSADVFTGVDQVRHVALGQQADLVIVAPATAHFLAQYASGMASDLLGTTLLATTAPVVVAPAMHTEMWGHGATVANIDTLTARGVHIVGPASGRLTGSDSGPGRMVEPEEIVSFALGVVGPKPLAGKKVVISGGGTREAIDPVRFIGNRSTGHMAVALATEALSRGATVTLVHAPLETPIPRGVGAVAVESATQMRDAVAEASTDADIVIMAAAVADWTLADPFTEKVSKNSDDTWTLTLQKTPDIAQELGKAKPAGQVLVGFAAETVADDDELIARALAKLESKNCDVIVANRVGNKLGFGETDTAVWFVQRSGAPVLSTGSKMTVAGHLFDVLLAT
jgi:phosphopantothenoylcysteine decarboxylase / phosphopantothenate---cysteine ligase